MTATTYNPCYDATVAISGDTVMTQNSDALTADQSTYSIAFGSIVAGYGVTKCRFDYALTDTVYGTVYSGIHFSSSSHTVSSVDVKLDGTIITDTSITETIGLYISNCF